MDNIIYDIATQAIGMLGSILMIVSYQLRSPKKLIATQALGGLMFSINFFMLGALTGALLNAVNVVRGIAFSKTKTKSKLLTAVLIALYVIATVFTYNGWLSLVVLLAQTVGTILFYLNDDKIIKTVCLVFVSPAWLIHNILTGSLGGIICESFAIVSIIVYIIRTKGFKYTSDMKKQA